MLTGALTMGFGMWAFFSPPRNLSTVALFAWLLVASFVVRTATSMYSIPYYALGVTLSRDYHERTSVTGIRNMANGLGTLLTASLSFVVFFPERVSGRDPKLAAGPYASMGLIFGALMTTVALVALWGTLRLRRTTDNDIEMRKPRVAGKWWHSMREALRNPSLRIMLLSFSLVVVGMAVSSSLLIHYLKYYVEVTGSVALGSTQAAFYGAGMAGTVFWLRIAGKFEKHYLYAFSSVTMAALMLAALALFGKGRPFGTGDVRPLLVGYGIAGFFGCILWFVPPSMLADVSDESEMMSGRRHEGALFGMLSFGKQIATGVALLLAGGLLDRYAGLSRGSPRQTPLAVWRIGILYSVLPASLFMAAALLMLRYRLSRSRVQAIQKELQQRRLADTAVHSV